MKKRILLLGTVVLLVLSLTDIKASNVLDYLSSSTLAVVSEPALPPAPTLVAKCTNYSITYPGPYEAGVVYYWHTAAGSIDQTQVLTASSFTAIPGTYYIRGYNGIWSVDKVVTLGTIMPPTIDVTATKAAICVGGTSTLKATGECTSYYWDHSLPNGANNDVSPITTTTYKVTGIDDNLCSNSKTIEIVVNVITPPTLAANNTGTNPIIDVMCKGKNQTIYAVDPGNNHITWYNNKTLVATDVTSYTLSNITGDVNLKARYQNPVNDCFSDTTKTLIKMMTVDFTMVQTVSLGGKLTITNNSKYASSYEWTLMNGQVKEEGPFANPIFHYNILGTKSIKLVAINATCKDSLTKTLIVSGIEDLKSNTDNILVYPNPFMKLVNVDLSGRNKDVSIAIYNFLGVKVMDKEIKKANDIATIDMPELPTGIYLMVLTIDKVTLTTKLRKE